MIRRKPAYIVSYDAPPGPIRRKTTRPAEQPRKAPAPLPLRRDQWPYRVLSGDEAPPDQMDTAQRVLSHIRRDHPELRYPSIRLVEPAAGRDAGNVRDHIAGPLTDDGGFPGGWVDPDFPHALYLLRQPNLDRLAYNTAHEVRHIIQARRHGAEAMHANRDAAERDADDFAARVIAELSGVYGGASW